MLLSGAAEVISLAAVFPFLEVLSNPEQLWQQPFTQHFASLIGITESNQLVLPVTIFFALSAVLSALVRLFNIWLNGILAASVGSDLSCKVYECILCQPYQVHLNRNSSEVVNSVITKINLTVGGLNAFLQLLASSVIGIGLLTSLLFVDPYIALTGFALFGGSYAILALVNRRELR